MKMMITDLDGTLLRNDGTLSPCNRETLVDLQRKGVVRVVATGRSIFSAKKVMSDDFPIDYLIFSTGAGIMDWKTKSLLLTNSMDRDSVSSLVSVFLDNEINFMLHREIPDNHHFYYYRGCGIVEDYERRLMIYGEYAEPYVPQVHNDVVATQFVTMLAEQTEFLKLRDMISQVEDALSYIRTTSPLDKKTIWLEIFGRGVNKSSAAKRLAEMLGIQRCDIMVIGNDWNDEDMLEWGGASYVVGNAPEEMREVYKVTADNEADGFSEAVKDWLGNG